MQNSFSRRTKVISGILVSTLVIGFLPWREIRADANTHGEYSAYPLEITYDQNSTWNYSTQGQFEVTNISEYDVTSWSFEIDYYDDVTLSNIWNVSGSVADGNVIVTSDITIEAGQTFTFGLIADGTDSAPVAPIAVSVLQYVSDEPQITPTVDPTPTEEITDTPTTEPDPVTDTPIPTEEAEPTVFPYAIFSGSTTADFSFQGWKSNITGDVYSGRDFLYQGSELYMEGYARTVGSVLPAGWITDMTGAEEGIEPLPMPDWSEAIAAKEALLPTITPDALTSQSSIVANGYYYSEDDITINGTDFTGDAVIISQGNITYNVDTLNAEEEITGKILLYSEEGNITINGTKIGICGILYAPQGSVTINAYDTTINGRIVADQFSYSGSILNVTADPSDLELVYDLPDVTVTALQSEVEVGQTAEYLIEIPKDNVYEIKYRLCGDDVEVTLPENEEDPVIFSFVPEEPGEYLFEAYVELSYGEFVLDSDTVTVTAIPTIDPTITPTSEPSPTTEPTITDTPVPTITATPTAIPTVTVVPTEPPTTTPTVEPTVTDTPIPTITTTVIPTDLPTPGPTTSVTPSPVPTEIPVPFTEKYAIYSQGDPQYNYLEYFDPELWIVDPDSCGRVTPTYVAAISDIFYADAKIYSDFYREFSPDYSFTMRFTYSNPILVGNASIIKIKNGSGASLDIQIDISKSSGGHTWKDPYGQGEWQTGNEPYNSMIGINLNGDGMKDYALAEYLPFIERNTVHEIWLEYVGSEETLYVYVATYDSNGEVTKPATPTLMLNISLAELFGNDHRMYIETDLDMGVHSTRTGVYIYGIEFDPYPLIHEDARETIEILSSLETEHHEVGDQISIVARTSPDITVDSATITVTDEYGNVVFEQAVDITSNYDEIANIDTTGWDTGDYIIEISVIDGDGEEYTKEVSLTLDPEAIYLDLEKALLEDGNIDIYGEVDFLEDGTYELKYFDPDDLLWKTITSDGEETSGILGSLDAEIYPYGNIYVDLIAVSDSGVRKSISKELLIELPYPTPTVTPTPTITPTPSGEFTDEELFVDIEDTQSGEEITFVADITGTVTGTELQYYTFEVFPVASEEAVYTYTGTDAVEEGVVGTIDPTLLMNGFYKVRLTAYADEGSFEDEITVLVTGQAKIGNFTVSFLDMTLSVAGLPVEIYRTYDSRQRTQQGDFGYGWTMSVGGPDVSISGNLGDGWTQDTASGVFGTNTYYWSEVYPHEIYIDWGNGHSETFELKLSPDSQQIMAITQGISASFVSKNGTSTLEVLNCDCTNLMYNQVDGKLYSIGLGEFNPTEFLLTRYDGVKFYFSVSDGLTKIEDAYGRTIEISDEGITYSEGGSITINRDADGRITSITDGTYTVNYTYDANGDLVSVTDKNGNTTSFEYVDHYLTGITDASGNKAATNVYDEDGRLISTTDAGGNTITFDHDIDSRVETVTNRLGYTTVYTYDENGNVLSATDARGNTTTYTYDSNNNKTSETDPLGNTITYSYDGNNNLTGATNAEGITAGETYSATGQVTSVTLGGTTALSLSYDSYGNLSSATDALGNTQSYGYSNDGKLTSLSDSIGDIVSITYDSNGNAASVTNAAGLVTTFTYDEYGRALTSSVTYNGTTLTDSYSYDANDNITQAISADGTITSYSYDVFGNMLSATNSFGTVSYSYDVYGNLTSVAYPDGTTESFTYDAENQVKTSTDRYGRTSTYTYDPVGNLTAITYSNGTTKSYSYDACNRVTSVTLPTGAVISYGYDSIGRNTSVTDGDGNTTSYTYNSQNLISSMTDAKGNTYSFSYDDAGNQTGVTYPNGGTYSASYDVRGRLISSTDSLGNTTSYSYDDADNLISVTDSLGFITSYEYDIAGNLTKITDPLGNETEYTYDSYGRYISQTNALGQTASVTYNTDGQIDSSTDFGGNTTYYTYDSLGRVTAAVINGSEITYTYDSYGNVLSVGDNEYTYTGSGLLNSKTDPNGNEVSYSYNTYYQLTGVSTTDVAVSYGYDQYGRIETVTDGEGNTTSYSYDEAGNLETVTYPNGVVTTYGYDSTNLVISIYTVNADGDVLQDYYYTRDLNGNITEADEGSRTVTYEYDALGRLISETVEDSSGTHVTEYTYDANSNRLSKSVDGVVTNYTYNEINQLIQAGNTTYTYDSAGNLVAQSENGALVASYEYNERNQLIRVTMAGINGSDIYEFEYDAAGNRIAQTINGVTTTYVVDSSSGYSQVLKAISGNNYVSYVRGFGLISRNDGTQTLYYLTDVTGTVRGLVDEEGIITDTYTFDSFGNLTESTGITDNCYGFQGEEQDETGLIYLRARYMDPETGRFLSMDSYGGNLANPTSQNRYLFANSNPIRYNDPSGHQTLGEMVTSMAIMTTLSTITNTLIAGFTYSTSVTDYSEFSFFEMFKQMGLAYLGGMIVGKLTVFATFLVFALALTAIEIILCMAICGILGFFTETIAGDFFSDNETVNQILKYISQGFYWTGIAIGFAGIAGGGNQSVYSSSTTIQGENYGGSGQDPLDWYASCDGNGDPRPVHVDDHSLPKLSKPNQGVFWDNPVSTTNELWESGELVSVNQQKNRTLYFFYSYNVGFGGGSNNINIEQMNYVKIVTENGNQIITSYPVPKP